MNEKVDHLLEESFLLNKVGLPAVLGVVLLMLILFGEVKSVIKESAINDGMVHYIQTEVYPDERVSIGEADTPFLSDTTNEQDYYIETSDGEVSRLTVVYIPSLDTHITK